MFLILSMLICLVPSLAWGRETSLGVVVVRPPPPIESTPNLDAIVSSTVIEGKELEGKRTLPELLAETAGVHIRRYGDLDDFATVSIRGSTSDQVSIYLDSLLLNPAEGGGVNLATIPTDQIERIEIYRGAAPARFGTSAMGGVIVIQTKQGRENRTTHLASSYGSFNTLETSLFQAQNLQPLGYAVDYHFARSDGDFSFLDDNGTPFNSADDRTTTRDNNEFARHNLLLKFSRSLEEGSLKLQETFLNEDRGIPGLGPLTSEQADLSTTRSATRIEWTKKNLTLAPFFQFQKQQFSDRAGEIGLGVEDNDDDTYQYGLDTTSTLLLGTHQRWILLASYRGEQFMPEDFLAETKGPNSSRHQASLNLEDEIFLWKEKVILNPSLRTEHFFDHFADESSSTHPISGKVGLRYRPRSPLTFKTNFARAYRLPNFSELFGDRGSLLGNAALVPEKGWNWDIGTAIQTDAFKLASAYFLNQTADLIQFIQTSQFTAQAKNLDAARIQGTETNLYLRIATPLEFSGNDTWQWPRDTSGLPGTNGKFLPGRPRHEATGRLTLFNRWGRLYSDLTYLDGNFLDSQNILRVSNRVLMGSGLSVTPVKWLTTSFDAKNLLNDRVVDVVGFPLPGRSYYGKIEISI